MPSNGFIISLILENEIINELKESTMPIFEYQCKSCGEKYEIYHSIKENTKDIICPECKSIDYKKLFSQFSASINNYKMREPLPTACSTCNHGQECGLN